MKRRGVVALILLFVGCIAVIAWTVAGLPPPKYLLRYGLTPGCEPTGETVTIDDVEFVEIGPGVFRMGSDHRAKGDLLGRLCRPLGLPWGEQPQPSCEMPVHWLEFRRGFWIAKTEVTNSEYERFDPGHRRSEYAKGDKDPVVEVSWEDAKRYCAWLSERTGRAVRLPTEAEWECACRGGSETDFCFGDDEEGLAQYAWFGKGWEGGAHAAATKRPNVWGLFDMHGNVWEWCEDTWHDSYEDAPGDGSAWVGEGTPYRVYRGGSWCNPAVNCRSAIRAWNHPGYRDRHLSFRPAFSPLKD